MTSLINLLKAHKLELLGFLLLSIFTSFLGVGVLHFINEYLLKSINGELIIYFVLILCLLFFSSIFLQIRLGIFGQNFIFQTQRKLVKQILDTDFLQIEKITKARLLASLNNDVRTISFGLLRFPDFVQSLILILASTAYLIYLSPKIFLLCSFFIVFILVIDYKCARKNYDFYKQTRNADDALQKNYENIIDGRRELTLNPFRAKFYYENDFEKNAKVKRLANIKSGIFSSLANNLNSVSFLAIVGLEFYFSIYFGWASLENATTIAIAILFLRAPLMAVSDTIPTLLMAKVALDKIEQLELIKYKPKFNNSVFEGEWKEIKFKDVGFEYDEKFALKPTTLSIKKGELVFLIGKNGSGKSTFSLIFAGLIKPESGAIFLDKMPINDENIALYRSLISAVYCDFHLFVQILGEKGEFASQSELAKWLDILGLAGKVSVKNNEFSTTKLSTGQRKRLALLVALLEKRDVLVLDEFAADQDPIFRRFFYTKLLTKLKNAGKTLFIISHDDRYFDVADRILLAKDGKISELKAAKGVDIRDFAKDLVEKFE